jgi:hypothetical protein
LFKIVEFEDSGWSQTPPPHCILPRSKNFDAALAAPANYKQTFKKKAKVNIRIRGFFSSGFT